MNFLAVKLCLLFCLLTASRTSSESLQHRDWYGFTIYVVLKNIAVIGLLMMIIYINSTHLVFLDSEIIVFFIFGISLIHIALVFSRNAWEAKHKKSLKNINWEECDSMEL